MATPARAQPADPPANLYDRTRISLNGTWQYVVEPMETGLRKPRSRRYFPDDAKAEPGGPLMEYDWDTSPEIEVPGDWNSQDARLWWYEGLVWYRKAFTPDVPEGTRAFLYFEGANYLAHVFFNGQKLGMHEGGFTPFAFEVTHQLRDSTNSLVLAVDNKRHADGIPAVDFDWWNYGGITRPVWLVLVPETYVHDYALRFSRFSITGHVALDGPAAADADVTVQISDLDLSRTLRTGLDGRATFSFAVDDLERWSPENPRLYDVTFATAQDTVTERIGFRTVAVEGTDIVLNGEPVFLRGICLHEEAFDAQGRRATSAADARALLEAAEALNANFVRLAHYPHSETMTRLADSLGLLVWSEIPVYWEDVDYEDPQTLALARQMMAATIDRDENRASVILWSVANETPITDARNAFLQTLIADVRRMDPTRLVTAALKVTDIGDGPELANAPADARLQRVDDPLGAYLDVLAVNTYVGWYGTAYPDSIQYVQWQTPYEKPMVLSEFGAGALPGYRGDRMERWTEEFQAYLIDETMQVAANTPFVRGTAPWLLKDFRTPRRYHGRYQQYWNRKGLLGPTGEPKLAYEALQQWYTRLAGQTPPQSPP